MTITQSSRRARVFRRPLAMFGTATLTGSLMLLGGSPALASDTDHTVCADGCEFSSIQDAIDESDSGDTITVNAGVYAEDLHIETPGITITGAGKAATVIVPAREYASNNRAISIYNAGNLTIRDLTIDGSGNTALAPGAHFHDGIWWEGGGDNTTIENVAVMNIDRRAISVFPETTVGTLIRNVDVSHVWGTHTGPAGGGFGILMHGSGAIENSTVTDARYAIGGNNNASSEHPVVLHDNIVTGLRFGTGGDDRFSIGFNFWLKNANKVEATGNSVSGDVPGNSGMYFVRPGAGSTISGNALNLAGERGIGIETGWSANDVEITNNAISMAAGATGIIVSGSGTDTDAVNISGNNLTNTSTAGPVENDYSTYGFQAAREVGILVSADPVTSRTGDANQPLHASVTDNSVAGFTNALAAIESDEHDFELTVDGNAFSATGSALVYGTLDEHRAFSPVPVDGASFPELDAASNYWGSAAPDAASVTRGWVNIDPVCGNAQCVAIATESSLSVTPRTILEGETVSVSATVSPADARGTVQLLSGDTVLDSERWVGDTVTFSLTPAQGTYEYIAKFVPDNAQHFTASSASAATVTVNPLKPRPQPSDPPAPDSNALLDYLAENDVDVAATTQSFVPQPGIDLTALDPATPLEGELPWPFEGDSYVDVYVYSTPLFLGTFPVVDGSVVLTGIDVSALQAGGHTLVFTGQTSGGVTAVAITLVEASQADVGSATGVVAVEGLATTGGSPLGVGAIAGFGLLAGGALLIGLRNRSRMQAVRTDSSQ